MKKREISERVLLIADDDPSVRRLIKAVAEGEGFSVIMAEDGKDAYKILRSGVIISVAIIDIMMPYVEGTELAKFMQSDARLKKIPVIIMTAESSPRVSSPSFASGASAFLSKPFSNDRLRAMLKTLDGGRLVKAAE